MPLSAFALLRSPPFEGIAPATAAVSAIAHEGISTHRSEDAIDRMFAAIRAAQVGGTFWARAARAGSPKTLIRVARRADIAAFGDAVSGDTLWLLPAARWARHAARRLRQAGRSAVIGDVDPWPLLTTAVQLHAHGGDEWVALAHIAGIATTLLSDGAFGLIGEPPAGRRTRAVDACLRVAYRDPFTGEPSTIDRTIALLADWRAIITANHGIAVAAGIARWKRTEIGRLLWAPRAVRLRYTTRPGRAVSIARRRAAGVAIWPSRVPQALLDESDRAQVALIRLEDGFVRSVGLGSALFPPFSITVDRRGIHYDPSGPSDLEHILETALFPSSLLDRAEALRRFIVEAGIGKYGAGVRHDLPSRDPARRLILVPGQVEDDMSVVFGGGGVSGNRDLLRRVRQIEPDAEIWFRPHPDVDAGHRRGSIPDADALRDADRVVRGGGMAALLDIVDGVHVLTSLTGFEALLRGRDVVTHGTPFYAGWGLTRDLGIVPMRRTRRVALLQLVAAVLILYPRYLDPVTGLPCPPEVLLQRLAIQHRPMRTWLTDLRALQGWFMRYRRSGRNADID